MLNYFFSAFIIFYEEVGELELAKVFWCVILMDGVMAAVARM